MRRGRKIVGWSLATTVILLLVALASSSFYMLDYALSPLHRSEQEALDRLGRHAPTDVMLWVDSVRRQALLHDTIIDIDGQPAHGYYLRSPRGTTATALLIHGYKDCALSMMHIACLYNRDLGMNVVMPDLPAHGATPGDHINMGWDNDIVHSLRWIALSDSLFRSDTAQVRMVLHGISMGASVVMNVGADALPSSVIALVEDCGYTSVWDEFACQLKEQFGLPEFPLMHTTSALCRIRYGWSFDQASSLLRVSDCHLPMLFIHGSDDSFVPTAMVRQLYDAKPGSKRLWLAPDSHHARAYSDHPTEYGSVVADFLSEQEFF